VSVRFEHEEAASSNVRAARLAGSGTQEIARWAPTLWFYVGVQLVESALADRGEHLTDHGERIASLAALGANTATYRKLQVLSGQWRYHGKEVTAGDIQNAERWTRDLCAELKERWPE
jgi:hypothetical protein